MTITLNQEQRIFLKSLINESVDYNYKKVKEFEEMNEVVPEDSQLKNLFVISYTLALLRFNTICQIREMITEKEKMISEAQNNEFVDL